MCVTSSGGQGSEAGGAGVTYLEAGEYKNLRVDNKCNLPEITMPSSHTATADDYATMLETGENEHLSAYPYLVRLPLLCY